MQRFAVVLFLLALCCASVAVAQERMLLTPDNAVDIRLQAVFGQGRPYAAAWLDDETFLVASATGLWRYGLSDATPEAVLPNGRPVYGVAASTDGRLLATCDESQIVVYDAATLAVMHSVPAASCEDAAYPLAFSPDGSRLAAADGKTSRIWTTRHWEEAGAFDHSTDLYTVQFLPDNTLVTRARDGRLRWWTPDGKTTHTIDVTALPTAVRADGALVAIAEYGHIDDVYRHFVAIRTVEGELRHALPTPFSRYTFAASDRFVTVGDGAVEFWDLATDTLVNRLEMDVRLPRQVIASPDGQHVLILGPSGVLAFRAQDARLVTSLNALHAEVERVLFSPDGTLLAVNNRANLRLWSLTSPAQVTVHASYPFRGVAFGADGALYTSGQETPLVQWLPLDGAQLQTLGEDYSAQLIVPIPDSDLMLLSSYRAGGVVIVWDMAEQRERFQLGEANMMDEVADIAVSRDGQRIAAITYMGDVSVWNRYGGARLALLGPYHDGSIWPAANGLTFSPNGDWLYYVESAAGLVHRWHVPTRSLAEPLAVDCAEALDTAISPDGALLAVACDHDVLVLESVSGRVLARLQGHMATVTTLAFSPDGMLLASGSNDGTARLWGVD